MEIKAPVLTPPPPHGPGPLTAADQAKVGPPAPGLVLAQAVAHLLIHHLSGMWADTSGAVDDTTANVNFFSIYAVT